MIQTIIIIVLCIYFIPTLIAVFRRNPLWSQIFITNLLLGWSIIFWVFSFRHAMGWDDLAGKNSNG